MKQSKRQPPDRKPSRADLSDLHGLWDELRQALPQLEKIVSRETDWRRLHPEEREAVAVITSLAYLIKQIIDAPLFDAEGNPVL